MFILMLSVVSRFKRGYKIIHVVIKKRSYGYEAVSKVRFVGADAIFIWL